MARAKRLELLGLVVLILTFGWQTQLEDVAKSHTASGRLLIMDEKLDTIWRHLGDISSYEDRNFLRDDWFNKDEYFRQTEEFLGLWPSQADTLTRFRIGLYFIGAGLLVLGKYSEYAFHRAKERETVTPENEASDLKDEGAATTAVASGNAKPLTVDCPLDESTPGGLTRSSARASKLAKPESDALGQGI